MLWFNCMVIFNHRQFKEIKQTLENNLKNENTKYLPSNFARCWLGLRWKSTKELWMSNKLSKLFKEVSRSFG